MSTIVVKIFGRLYELSEAEVSMLSCNDENARYLGSLPRFWFVDVDDIYIPNGVYDCTLEN